MKPDLLMMCGIPSRQLEQLEQRYTLHRYDQADDPDALLSEIAERVTALSTGGGTGLTRAVIAKLPKLALAASNGVGYDAIDIAACTEHGVKVTNTPDVLTDDVADTAIMLMLASWRELVKGHHWVREGTWQKDGMMPLTHALRGRRLGILGMGRIGQAIADRAEPMGLEIGYYNRSRKADSSYVYHDNAVSLAEWCDILVLACPGGESTRGIVNQAVIDAVGPEGCLVNIARGSVVDEPALIDALQNGRLGRAGLDVFASEPDVDPALPVLPNVTLYPHHASGTVETRDAMAQLVVDNIDAFFADKPLLTPVN